MSFIPLSFRSASLLASAVTALACGTNPTSNASLDATAAGGGEAVPGAAGSSAAASAPGATSGAPSATPIGGARSGVPPEVTSANPSSGGSAPGGSSGVGARSGDTASGSPADSTSSSTAEASGSPSSSAGEAFTDVAPGSTTTAHPSDAATQTDPSTDGTSTDVAESEGTPNWGASELAEAYPCDGSTDGYDAVVTSAGDGWSVNGSQHASLHQALVSAFGNGGSSASSQRRVLLHDGGEIAADVQLRIPSNTVFNACGTITVVEPAGGSDRSPCYARNATNIDIPHITIRGRPQYGCFFRDVDDVHIGVADIRIAGGLGLRFDNNPGGNDWANSSSNAARRSGFRLDDVYVEGASHGVEFYGIEDITIGRIVARNTSQAGLMLNNSRHVDVGLVDGQGVSPDAGYAVLRMANDNGKDWDTQSHPMTIRVRKVVARESGGPRGLGIFCLTDSGGVTIDEVDIEHSAGNSIWLEWCTNVKIGNPTTPSRVHDSGSFMISYGTETRMSNQLVFENMALTGTSIDFHQSCPPNVTWVDVTRDGNLVSSCQ